MLEVRGDGVNFGSGGSGVYDSGSYEHQRVRVVILVSQRYHQHHRYH